jgi:polar amino acid transport system substrate-binding protein
MCKYLASILCLTFFSINIFAQSINLKTEHYPPYSIDLTLEGDGIGIGGLGTEIVVEMMRRSGYAYTMDLVPWNRAYNAALKENYTGVFTAARTETREKLFKWVGPIADNNYVLFANSNSEINIDSNKDLENYSIGAYRGDIGVSLLKSIGIKPEIVRSDHLNILKLKRNRIDLWMSSNLYGRYLAKQYDAPDLKEVYTVRKAQVFAAFNLNTPDTIILELNKILQEMRDDGFIDDVYSRYM